MNKIITTKKNHSGLIFLIQSTFCKVKKNFKPNIGKMFSEMDYWILGFLRFFYIHSFYILSFTNLVFTYSVLHTQFLRGVYLISFLSLQFWMWRLIINISTQHNHPKRLKSRMSICKNQNKKKLKMTASSTCMLLLLQYHH